GGGEGGGGVRGGDGEAPRRPGRGGGGEAADGQAAGRRRGAGRLDDQRPGVERPGTGPPVNDLQLPGALGVLAREGRQTPFRLIRAGEGRIAGPDWGGGLVVEGRVLEVGAPTLEGGQRHVGAVRRDQVDRQVVVQGVRHVELHLDAGDGHALADVDGGGREHVGEIDRLRHVGGVEGHGAQQGAVLQVLYRRPEGPPGRRPGRGPARRA